MKNVITNKPEPAPGILKRVDLFAIAIGMVVGSGMVTLIGPAMAYTGYSVWLAYLAAIIMGFYGVPVHYSFRNASACWRPVFHCNKPGRCQCRRVDLLLQISNADSEQFLCTGFRYVCP